MSTRQFMKSDLINKYIIFMNSLNDMTNKTNDTRLKEFCKKSLIDFINGLYKIDKEYKEEYLIVLEKFNLNKESLVEFEEEKIKKKKSNNKLKIFSKYEKELENIFINPNEDSIKVWLKNIISFADDNNINENELNDFITNKFELLDIKNEYKNKLKEYIDEIKNTKVENKKELEITNESTKIQKLSKENNKSNEKESNKKEDDVEPLKIINVKKSFNIKLKNKALALTALVGIGGTFINPIIGILLGIATYKLYQKTGIFVNDLIEKNGYTINENNDLIDQNKKIVTKEDIGKLRYNLIKTQLMNNNNNNNNNNGIIDKDYKKNKLTSLLLENNVVKNIKNGYKTIIKDDYESTQLVKDLKKGMRNV